MLSALWAVLDVPECEEWAALAYVVHGMLYTTRGCTVDRVDEYSRYSTLLSLSERERR